MGSLKVMLCPRCFDLSVLAQDFDAHPLDFHLSVVVSGLISLAAAQELRLRMSTFVL